MCEGGYKVSIYKPKIGSRSAACVYRVVDVQSKFGEQERRVELLEA